MARLKSMMVKHDGVTWLIVSLVGKLATGIWPYGKSFFIQRLETH